MAPHPGSAPRPPDGGAAAPWAARPSVRGAAALAAFVAVIGAGAVFRILALAALPGFFGPGDPATYFAMALGVRHEGVPRIGFIWNFASMPATIAHVESYYEPAFAYLLAGAMALFGDRVFVARAVATLFGIAAPVLVYAFTRRLGRRVAIVAAALVALEPWSIYYAGVLMKETLVSVVVLLALEATRRVLEAPGSGFRTGLAAAGIVIGACLFQYELLPILAPAVVIAMAFHRRDALAAYIAATTAVVGIAAGLTWWAMGVPLSSKFMFFLGRNLWTPEAGMKASTGVLRFVPVGYVLGALLLKWYACVLALAWVGARAGRLSRIEVVLPAAFTAFFLYFHGVPHDLWQRDFIPLLPVLAPLVAVAACTPAAWSGRGALAPGVLAIGLIAGAAIGTWAALTLHIHGEFPASWMPWSVILASALVAIPCTLLARRLSSAFATRPFARALPAISLGVVLAMYSQALPWALIFRNPQFRGYEARRAAREAAAVLLRGAVAEGPVMTSSPSEISFYSGLPTVLTPVTRNPAAIAEARSRYRVRYLFAEDGELSEATIAALGLSPVARFHRRVVYAFPGAMPVAASPGRRYDAARTGRAASLQR